MPPPPSVPVHSPSKVEDLWGLIGRPGGVGLSACWAALWEGEELAGLVGKGDASRGRRLLRIVEAAGLIDANGDGNVTLEELRRLGDSQILAEAEAAVDAGLDPWRLKDLRAKASAVWRQLSGGQPLAPRARSALTPPQCWDLVLDDLELADVVGDGRKAKGRQLLLAMRALGVLSGPEGGPEQSGGGVVSGKAFGRLCSPLALVQAEAAVASKMDPAALLNL